MNRFFQAAGLVLLLATPTVVCAQTPGQAWQQTWQLARQHFPALQVTEFDLSDSSWMICQAGTQQELEAFANSKYSFRDAEILASFWNQGLDDSKARIGRKILFGSASVDLLDQELRAGRSQALASVNQLRFFRESYSFRDAETLARFWGEPGPFEAKLRMERKIITGDEATLQAELQKAASASVPTNTPPPNPPANPGGSLTNLKPDPGQPVTTRRPDVSANFSSRPHRNSVVLLVDSIDRTQESTFSPNEQFLRWTPSQDLSFGNHAVELRAIGQNGETFAKTWTFSVPRQKAPNKPGPTNTGGTEKFYDTQLNFGLDIPPGWQRQVTTPLFALRLNNHGSTFEVASGPAPDPQAAVNAARNHLIQLGAQIQNQYPTQLAGTPATRLDYSIPRQGRFGQMVICVTEKNQSFLAAAESHNLNGFPIANDVKTMFQTFLINAR